MEGAQPGHVEVVVAAVLRAVGQHRAVRPDRGGHPAVGCHGVTRGGGQLDAPAQQALDLVAVRPLGAEALEGHLVRRGGRDLGPGGEELPVGPLDRLRVVAQQARRPQVARQVVAVLLEQRGEAAVEDDGALGDGVRRSRAGHAQSLAPEGCAPRAGLVGDDRGVPEGHTIHRLARRHARLLGGQRVSADSPQGRSRTARALLDGRVLTATDAWGKHLFHRYDDLWLHVHLGLYGKFRDGLLPAPGPAVPCGCGCSATGHWLELRGPTACEVLTEAERRPCSPGSVPTRCAGGPTPAAFVARVLRSRAPIATLLMDQSVVAGVGNVYRAEVLFRQRLDPFRPGRLHDVAVLHALWGDLVALLRAGSAGRAHRHHAPRATASAPRAGRAARTRTTSTAAPPCRAGSAGHRCRTRPSRRVGCSGARSARPPDAVRRSVPAPSPGPRRGRCGRGPAG